MKFTVEIETADYVAGVDIDARLSAMFGAKNCKIISKQHSTHPAEALPEPVACALRSVSKWLNEELSGPIDKVALARLCAFVQLTSPDAARVPDGYVLVPREATEKMLDYAVAYALNVSVHGEGGWSKYMAEVWRRMLLAATPPSSAVSDATVKDSLTAQPTIIAAIGEER